MIMKNLPPLKSMVFIVVLIACVGFITACAPTPSAQTPSPAYPGPETTAAYPAAQQTPAAGQIANPAAVYCGQNGGKSQIRTAADGSQTGACVFSDGSECEEWAYYRKQCAPGTPAAPAQPGADLATPGSLNGAQATVAAAARASLAAKLKVDAPSLTLVAVNSNDWPDACLGLAGAGEMCAAVITPGYQVILASGGVQYFYRTDATGAQVKEDSHGVIITPSGVQ
jgi:putative hemolysin